MSDAGVFLSVLRAWAGSARERGTDLGLGHYDILYRRKIYGIERRPSCRGLAA